MHLVVDEEVDQVAVAGDLIQRILDAIGFLPMNTDEFLGEQLYEDIAEFMVVNDFWEEEG